MFDCLVVGFGVAGIAVTAHLEGKGKSVFVVDANLTKASVVAAGMYNPVILKRFSMAWNADTQLEYAKEFYCGLEKKFKKKFDEPLPVLRRFNSVKEQNAWFTKLNNPALGKYMSDELLSSSSSLAIKTPFKCGQVKHTGRILVADLVESYTSNLSGKETFLEEAFDYSFLEINEGSINYKGVKAKHIIFCEGHNLLQNPYFKELPLIGNKGCYIIVECQGLDLKEAFKAHFFIIPLGNNQYKFGATYEHRFKGEDHDEAAKKHLIEELDKLISIPYKVLSQKVGVRPTVIDRRPLVGQHKQHKSLYICNGMGTRGIMLAPTAAKHLVNYIIDKEPIPVEFNISRFE